MLTIKPGDRPTAEEVLNDEWFGPQTPTLKQSEIEMKHKQGGFKKYQNQHGQKLEILTKNKSKTEEDLPGTANKEPNSYTSTDYQSPYVLE